MSAPLLVLENLVKRFGEVTAVRGIDLEIGAGEFVAIMGPSGCGKTTTLRLIAGLERPTEGEIRLRGRRINEVQPWDRDTPMVWQSLALFPFLSVLHNVEFGLKMRGVTSRERRAKAHDWLERLGIAAFRDRVVGQLSGGERQRVALARALITEPEILLLDEPMSALDAHLVVRMQAELTQLQEQLGITFCYVTHNQSEAFAMADRVVIMNEGEIQQVGTPREVYRAPANRFVAEFVGANNILEGRILELDDARVTVETGVGTLTAIRPSHLELAPGKVVNLVISADRVALSADRGGHDNSLVGTLIGEEFIGAVVTLYFDVGGTEFRVQKQQHELDDLDLGRGRALVLSWGPEHVFMLSAERKRSSS